MSTVLELTTLDSSVKIGSAINMEDDILLSENIRVSTSSSSEGPRNVSIDAGAQITPKLRRAIPSSCKLCLGDVAPQDMYGLEQCTCSFCYSCMDEYLTVEIMQGNVISISCPDGACEQHGLIEEDEIKRLVVEDMFATYRWRRYQKEVDMDPARMFCPKPGCDTVLNVKDIAQEIRNMRPIAVQCYKCNARFCSICKEEWHIRQTCDQFMRKKYRGDGTDGGIPFVSGEDDQIKRCPACRVPIERNDGCAQMMCKNCKHVFCWFCLVSLDGDFLLRHYDKGQCKNRLGHSRASVMWHRTQVVGIFAGFGVLLLVASPFLLLAAPCILCCRCKSCNVNEDDDPEVVTASTSNRQGLTPL